MAAGRWLLVVAIAGSAGCASWSRRDTALEAGFFVATTVDWQQTQDITLACDEVNPVIGTCGQRVPVSLYFPVLLVAHAAIAALLPPRWRTAFQAFTAGMEVSTTYWNSQLTLDPPVSARRAP